MIRHLLVLAGILILATFGINYYLVIDDMKDCNVEPSDRSNCQIVDAAIAISGGDTNARTDTAIELYKYGWTDTLIFSGAAKDKTGPSNAAVMKGRAIEAGVPESAIIIDEFSESTKQNSVNAQLIFDKYDIESVILVTSPYHQRRASLEFNKNTKARIINHPVKYDKDWSVWWWLNPSSWWLVGSELVRIIVFFVMGI